MSDRNDDPAFIYFPTNYRWSMGLLLCLSAAPWGGAEIDEVNRVGRALRDRIGDDEAWFDEWVKMGDKVKCFLYSIVISRIFHDRRHDTLRKIIQDLNGRIFAANSRSLLH